MNARRLLAVSCLIAAAGLGRHAHAGPINEFFRDLGLGWSDGYHARPPACRCAGQCGALTGAPIASEAPTHRWPDRTARAPLRRTAPLAPSLRRAAPTRPNPWRPGRGG